VADAVFTVTNPEAPRLAVADDIRETAQRVADTAQANTPVVTGRMAASWEVQQGDDPATSFVVNTAPYSRFVEYGTRYMTAEAPLGRALAQEAAR
jgi:HK97 gp10 family phage protein